MNQYKNYNQSLSLRGIINSFKNAVNGFTVLLRHEYNLYLQIAFAVVAIIFGFIFDISSTQWMIQSIAIGLVIFSELMNTAVEKIMDIVHPQYDKRVKEIKDIAAASVLFTVAIAVTVGCIIYLPHIIPLFV